MSKEERYFDREGVYDSKISDYAETTDIVNKLNSISDLETQLAEKEKRQNQKAIEQLEQIINLFELYENEQKDTILCANNGISFLEYINQQITLLKGE